MPQLIALVLIGGIVFIALRAFRKQMKKVGEELDRQERVASDKNVRPLQKDSDGVYRPRDDVE